MMWTLLLQWINKYKIYVISIAILVAFIAGFKLADTLQKATALKQYQTLLQVIKKNDETSRKQVLDYQTRMITLNNDYSTLQGRLKNVKITTSNCTATIAGVSLWNDSLKGQSIPMSKDTTRIIEDSSTASAFTVEELMQNKLENDRICNELRGQINAIIQWDKESFK